MLSFLLCSRERAQSDRRKVEERLRGSSDASLKALQRATIAEVRSYTPGYDIP